MSDTHSWNWLPPRLTARKVTEGMAAEETGRPCLPEVERLDDRILLSASVKAAAAETGGGGTTQVLIGLLRDGTDLVKGELGVLQAARPTDPAGTKDLRGTWKLAQDFWKLDDLLFDAAEGSAKGQPQDLSKIRLDDAFKKIADDAADLGGLSDGQLLPAVQRAAGQYLADLNLAGLTFKKADFTWKIVEDFAKVDDLVYRIGADAVIRGDLAGSKGDSPDVFLGHLEDAFAKLDQVISASGDSSIIGVLLPAVQRAEDELLPYIRGLIGQTGGDQFPGGVTLPDAGGDVIA
jgi:hypothetical protein